MIKEQEVNEAYASGIFVETFFTVLCYFERISIVVINPIVWILVNT